VNNKLKYPQRIKVKIFKGESGAYIVEFPEYDVFTEFDSFQDINFYVNDLIYTLFDVPKGQQNDLVYLPSKEPQRQVPEFRGKSASVLFSVLCTPDYYKEYGCLK